MAIITSIDRLLAVADHSTTRMMLDANILIALLDKAHKKHGPIKTALQHLFVGGATLYFVQPCYLELLDYWRRKSFYEYLEELHTAGSKMPGRFEQAYRFHLEELRKHAGARPDAYFSDYVIKDLRDHLLRVGGKNQRHLGRELWQNLCRKTFADRFSKLNETLKILGITYAKFADDDVYPVESKASWPKWETMIALIEGHCLASNDAAILNMVAGGQGITAFMSNDYDVLIAAEGGALPEQLSCHTLLPW